MERVQDSYSSAISQFPQQPSRPIDIDYSYPYPSYGGYYEIGSQESGEQYMEIPQYQFSSAMPQFPQPSRPVDIDYMNMYEEGYPNQFCGGYYGCYHQESREQYVTDDDLFHIFRETAQEHDGSNAHEIFEKFVSKVKKEVHFDRLEKFYKLVNPENHMTAQGYQERSINIEASSTKGDIKHKLERFKIKNLNLGGVVKQEKQS